MSTTEVRTAEASTADVSTDTRRAWSLQARLMVTIIGIVALIIVGIAFAISAFLGQILQDNLTAKVSERAQETAQVLLSLQGHPATGGRTVTAYDVLSAGRQEPGVMLVLSSGSGLTNGAVVGSDGSVEELTAEQVSDVVGDVTHPGSASISVEGIGEYRVYAYQLQNYVAIVGMPLSEVQSTIAKIFAAVLGISAIGLVVLAVAIALIVRAGLRPLRAVA